MIMPRADTPKTGFRPFFNPATGEWITYTATAEDNGGQLVRFTWRSVPGGVITEHVHPRQEERFTILAGEAHFTLNGQHHVAGAGETIIVPAGVPHSEGNPGPGEIESIVELRPALHAKELHEAFAGLVADGKTAPRAHRATRSSSAPPSGTSATKAGSPHHPIGRRTSCSPRYGRWPGPSTSAPTTTGATAASQTPAQSTHNYPATHRRNRGVPRPVSRALYGGGNRHEGRCLRRGGGRRRSRRVECGARSGPGPATGRGDRRRCSAERPRRSHARVLVPRRDAASRPPRRGTGRGDRLRRGACQRPGAGHRAGVRGASGQRTNSDRSADPDGDRSRRRTTRRSRAPPTVG